MVFYLWFSGYSGWNPKILIKRIYEVFLVIKHRFFFPSLVHLFNLSLIKQGLIQESLMKKKKYKQVEIEQVSRIRN